MSRRFTFGGAAVMVCVLLLAGCNNDNSPIGAGLITPSQFDINMIDSVRLRVSTIVYDSIPTSNFAPITDKAAALGRLLVGHADDPKLGPVTVSTVFQLTPPTRPKLDPFLTHYTSLSLVLTQDGYSYYDTTQTMTFKVYRLIQPVKYYSGYRYSKDTFAVDESSLLGSITFQPRPKLKDTTEIFLPDALGQELMTYAQSGNEVLATGSNFDKYFYGFALVPDTTESRAILGFKAAPVMRLRYLDDNVAPLAKPQKKYDFTFSGTNQYYVKYDVPRTGTKLAALQTRGDEILSTESDNEGYLQAGSAVSLRIVAPYIKNLTYIRENFTSTRAILTMTPVWTSDTKATPLPATLNVDLVSSNNATLANDFVQAVLVTDFFGNKTYRLDVTAYINGEALSGDATHNALLVKIPATDLGSTVNRLYIHDQNGEYRMKLEIYFLTLSEQ